MAVGRVEGQRVQADARRGDFSVNVVAIERAANDEGYDWTRHLVEQSADLRTIVVIIDRQRDRHDLTGVGVYAEM